MENTFNEKIIPDFKRHLISTYKKTTTINKLSHVQLIVEFYFWLKALDKRFEPFERHVAAAKKFDDYWHDLKKSFHLIYRASQLFEEKSLSWNLDTAFRWIPRLLEQDKADQEAIAEREDERKRAKETLRQLRANRNKDNR